MTDNTTTTTNTVTGAVRERLDQALEQLAAAERVLTARVPDPAALYAAVDGAIRLADALAYLVTTVIRQAPAGLDPGTDPDSGANTCPVLDELLADLRAMHGCLMTGPLLLAPARDDLHRLVINQGITPATHQATTQKEGPAMPHHKPDDMFEGALDDAAPDGDVADQQRPAHPEHTDDEPDHDEALDGVGEVLEADPADMADQRRDAPVLDETEPWP